MDTATERKVHLYGVRHHGPGSARSLLNALEQLAPDCILVEGPEDANDLVELAGHEAMQPPVALLVYDPQEPRRCAFYPFAEFSPEWQAIRFGLARQIPVRFCDLPMRHWLAIGKAEEDSANAEPKEEEPTEDSSDWRYDPVSLLAQAAGFDDTERWWEQLVEQRIDASDVFEAVAEAMRALRAELADEPAPEARREALREAYMRSRIREAQKEGFSRIAVVCGAWHVPALEKLPPAKEDQSLLKGLPKIKVEATWVPWTYRRLASSSGYGAGVPSPGWYEFLWLMVPRGADSSRLSTHWLARVARVLRERDFDVSSAHLIEAVRIVDAICALRDRPLPGLEELNEAIVSVLLFGDATPLALVHEKLVIGDAMGSVPPESPAVPLQGDLEQQQKRLRLKPTADIKEIDLDLRGETDLARSQLLHRLTLLEIPWGQQTSRRSRGTFREAWRLRWQPEFAVAIVAAAIYGNTVESAATRSVIARAAKARQLSEIAELIQIVLLAELPDAITFASERLEAMSAVTADLAQLMDAVPPLVQVARYGNVRGTQTQSVSPVLASMVVRLCVGLGGACSNLNDEAASAMADRIASVDAALMILEDKELRDEWTKALANLLDGNLAGKITGKVCRLLLDSGFIDAAEAARHLGLALSRGTDPLQAGAWVEGFLGGSGMLLVHSEDLWSIVNGWVGALTPEQFIDVLPILRRTFSAFAVAERRLMGERVRSNWSSGATRLKPSLRIDESRANATLPMLSLILGSGEKT